MTSNSKKKISPRALVSLARQAPPSGRGVTGGGLAVYGETINVLRNSKGMTWDQISAWLYDQGVPRRYSASGIAGALRKHLQDKASAPSSTQP